MADQEFPKDIFVTLDFDDDDVPLMLNAELDMKSVIGMEQRCRVGVYRLVEVVEVVQEYRIVVRQPATPPKKKGRT